MSGRTARGIALDTLVAVAEDGARANLDLPARLSRSDLDARDRGLATELTYGTVRMQRACDWLVDRFAKGRTDPQVRAALRLGAYQIGWTRIPPHAAVAATVDEVRGPGRGMVNAVLRRVADAAKAGPLRWPDPATELSYPDWIVARMATDLGPGPARAALLTMNRPAEVTERADGYIQDRASQLVSAFVGAQPGELILDACAAPGGKATAMGNGATVVAADRDPARVATIADNVGRLGLRSSVLPVVADAERAPWRAKVFDRVLLDAPCSGLGVLRRRPDARWRVQAGDVERLANLQVRLLEANLPLLRPGGVLVYSVCTLTGAETLGVDRWLAERHPELEALPPPAAPFEPHGRGGLLLPQTEGTDGMFALAFQLPG